MNLSIEAFNALSTIDISTLDLKTLNKLPRSVMQELQALLTPKMTPYIPHVPTPKQAAFMLLDNKEAFYGGAAGGGKSDALLMAGLQNVDVKGYAGIIFRRNYADLVKPGALIDRSKEWLFRFNNIRWVDKEKKFEFLQKYGPHTEIYSILQFGYLETDNDRFNYQGGEYQFIGFDELTHITEICYLYLFSRLRRLKNVRIPLRVRGASNPPDDDQGGWVYTRFVNPETKKKGTVFVPAGLDDNPFLDKAAYEESLAELDPVTRARLRDGNWTIVRKGNMFKRNWFEVVDAPPLYRRRVRFWDMASTDDKLKKKRQHDPDYTVGFLMSEANGIYYIEDIVRVRKRPEQTEALQKTTAVSDGYSTLIFEEQEPGSSGDAVIDNKARTVLKSYTYKGVRSTGSKVTRAEAFSAAAERGHVKVVRGCRNIEAFFDEAESFPGGLHDDTVDGASGAFNELRVMPKLYLPIQVGVSEASYWNTFGDGEVADFAGYFSNM
jgi:predicted phage terminase large subunit-like protein